MTMPNFLVIGAQKAGTTSLYYYLKQHPQIYMSPVKEPNFFAFEGETPDFVGPDGEEAPVNEYTVTEIGAYRALFREVSNETAVGEASTLYLHLPESAERIRRHVPEAKLVAVLRDPAERAYSSFLHCIRDGREPLGDFSRALREEEKRIRDNWGFIWRYKQMGFYHARLKRYFDMFDRDQIRVYLYEDLRAEPVVMLRDIFRFLGVDQAFVPDMSRRHNIGGVPRRESLHTFLTRPNPIKSFVKPFLPPRVRERVAAPIKGLVVTAPPQLPPEVRRELVEEYREDILKLQDLIDRDLSGWLR